jgi:hypothetical protein
MIYCSATVSKSEQIPEDGKAGRKHIENYVILMPF